MATTTTSSAAGPSAPDGPPRSDGLPTLPKAPTGIRGLDEVTGGGLPRGRPTLVCGPAGSGKTLLAMEFLVRGITQFGEPGVFMAFEETRDDLVANVASLGFDLPQLEARRHARASITSTSSPPSCVEAGDWDLEGLFIRLGAAIDAVGAKRVVIDTIETLFGAFTDTATLRSELQRLFVWLKARGVTAVITGERGDGTLTRHGIEEYVSDCVIVLDHLVTEETVDPAAARPQVSRLAARDQPVPVPDRRARHLRAADHLARSAARGVQRAGVHGRGPSRRDARRCGPYRGSSVLVSGTAGTGKSTLAAQFCDAACRAGRAGDLLRLRGVPGPDHPQHVLGGHGPATRGSRRACCSSGACARACSASRRTCWRCRTWSTSSIPSVVVHGPDLGPGRHRHRSRDVSAMLTRQVDFLKARGVTALFTSLASDDGSRPRPISSSPR